jgi:hypothetical protein
MTTVSLDNDSWSRKESWKYKLRRLHVRYRGEVGRGNNITSAAGTSGSYTAKLKTDCTEGKGLELCLATRGEASDS